MHESTYMHAGRILNLITAAGGLPPGTVAVDVGSQDVNGTYRPLFEARGLKYVGLDKTAGTNVDLVEDIEYPSKEYEWDFVICGQVLEHVENPILAAVNMKRFLKPGGWIVLSVPTHIDYHAHPIDCWRVREDGMRNVLLGGLECVQIDTGRWNGKSGFGDIHGWGRKPADYRERWEIRDLLRTA